MNCARLAAAVLAESLGKTLKQPVIVENRPGAGSTLAPAFVANASPDGHTLLVAPNSVLGVNKLMFPDTVKYGAADFTPINRLAAPGYETAALKSRAEFREFSDQEMIVARKQMGAAGSALPVR